MGFFEIAFVLSYINWCFLLFWCCNWCGPIYGSFVFFLGHLTRFRIHLLFFGCIDSYLRMEYVWFMAVDKHNYGSWSRAASHLDGVMMKTRLFENQSQELWRRNKLEIWLYQRFTSFHISNLWYYANLAGCFISTSNWNDFLNRLIFCEFLARLEGFQS